MDMQMPREPRPGHAAQIDPDIISFRLKRLLQQCFSRSQKLKQIFPFDLCQFTEIINMTVGYNERVTVIVGVNVQDRVRMFCAHHNIILGVPFLPEYGAEYTAFLLFKNVPDIFQPPGAQSLSTIILSV